MLGNYTEPWLHCDTRETQSALETLVRGWSIVNSCKHKLTIKSQQMLITSLRSKMHLFEIRETEPVEASTETAEPASEGLRMLQRER